MFNDYRFGVLVERLQDMSARQVVGHFCTKLLFGMTLTLANYSSALVHLPKSLVTMVRPLLTLHRKQVIRMS